jgi:hypothetical protein
MPQPLRFYEFASVSAKPLPIRLLKVMECSQQAR